MFFRICSLTIVLSYSFSVNADTFNTCRAVNTLAEIIMIKRQEGFQAATLAEALDSPKVPETGQKLTIPMIEDAYSYPRYRVSENRQRAVNEFANKYYLECLRQERKAME